MGIEGRTNICWSPADRGNDIATNKGGTHELEIIESLNFFLIVGQRIRALLYAVIPAVSPPVARDTSLLLPKWRKL